MGLLDHLRPPRWKHPDPQERAAAVRALSSDQAEILRSLAREDADARVRRAALRRIDDPVLLAEAARADAAEEVRREAEDLLLAIALKAVDEERGAAALAGLGAAKRLARVAQGARLPMLRRAALARLDDPRAFVSVACHAPDRATRLEALRRLSDPAHLADVAARGDQEDTCLAAVEAIGDRGVLKTVAARARNERVALGARARLEALGPEPQPPDPDVLRARRAAICQDVEFLRHSDNDDRGRAGLDGAEAAWGDLDPPIEEDLARRFAEARRVLLERLSLHASERAEWDRRSREIGEAVAARRALCEAVEAAEGALAPERLTEARAAWAALRPLDHPDIAPLERRFAQAGRRCEARHAEWSAARERRARLEDLCGAAESLEMSDGAPDSDERFTELRRQWADLAGGGEERDLLARFDASVARRAERGAAARRDDERRRGENLARLEELCGASDRLLRSGRLTLKEADGGWREIAAAVEQAAPLPSRGEALRLTRRLRRLKAALGARVRDLRETGEWRRWASANVMEDLCARLEALRDAPDVEGAARQLRDIERSWRQARGRPKEEPDPLEQRFEAARQEVRSRHGALRAHRAEEQAENLKRKEALCVQAEALGESTDWVRAAEQIKDLQTQWQTIGPVPRPLSVAIWQRFRTPCDRFFTRRKEDLESRKQKWAQNLARKTALCEQAESLAESADWDRAAAEIKRFQAEWKTIGPIRRNRSEALWLRLRGACDRFFARHAQREALDREARRAAREALCGEIEALLPSDQTPPGAPEGLAERVREARARWRQAAPEGDADGPLRERYQAALERLLSAYPESFQGTELDCEANRRMMEQLCERVEGLLSSASAALATGASPAAILAAHWREAMASNTMGGGQDLRRRATAAAEIKSAQAAWGRLGPVSGDAGAALARRFQAACKRIMKQDAAAGRARG